MSKPTKKEFIAAHLGQPISQSDVDKLWKFQNTKHVTQRAGPSIKPVRKGKRSLNQSQRIVPADTHHALSVCAKKYIHAAVDPFNAPSGACVPTGTVRETRRTTSWARGTFTVGTAGVGFVLCDPKAAGWSDSNCLFHTNGTYAADYVDQASIAPDITIVQLLNSPFQYSDREGPEAVTPGLNARTRIVGCGLRIRATGQQQQLSGVAIGLQEPDNLTFEDYGVEAFDSYQETRQVDVGSDRQWVELIWIAKEEDDLAFSQPTYVTGTTLPDSNFGFFVTGAEAATTFAYELVIHREWIGLMADKKPSESDPTGFAAVQTTLARPEFIGGRKINGSNNKDNFMQKAGKYVMEHVSGVATWMKNHEKEIVAAGGALGALFL